MTSLAVVKTFGEAIYPGLYSVGRLERGAGKPFHMIINAENYHALQTLLYAYEGLIDCIYIDPPYNTGARDWKYNNDYVDSNDAFRHSKWLSFMEKRLVLAKRLLRPEDSVLIVTIDDTEAYSLGLLLDQVFRDFERQMVSVTISPRGKSRDAQVGEVGEQNEDTEVRWRYLRRNDIESARGTKKGGPRQFYPIYVDSVTGQIAKIGEPLSPDDALEKAETIAGLTPVFPIREDGVHMNWGLTGPSVKRALDQGYVRVTRGSHDQQPYTFSYLTAPNIRRVESSTYRVAGTRPDGSKIVVIPGGRANRPTTAWRDSRYDAGAYGTSLLRNLIPGRKFPFPKSLYTVEDTLRLFVGDKPQSLILDFFAGSGTTTHAVMRLNHQDGGERRSISITNNEVGEAEASVLRAGDHSPGDKVWEDSGIFAFVTVPRITAALTGKTPDGTPIVGNYKFADEFPLADGFEENAEFFKLEYLDPDSVSRGLAFEAIAPLLWLQAGGMGPRVDKETADYAITDPPGKYGVLFDVGYWRGFADALDQRPDVKRAFIVTDSLSAYQQVIKAIPPGVETSMLFDDYLRNFEITSGDLR